MEILIRKLEQIKWVLNMKRLRQRKKHKDFALKRLKRHSRRKNRLIEKYPSKR